MKDCGGAQHAIDWPEDDARIDAIGQNGGDGLHYSEVDESPGVVHPAQKPSS